MIFVLICICTKKEGSKESSQDSMEFGFVRSILDLIETAQDLGLCVDLIIAYRR